MLGPAAGGFLYETFGATSPFSTAAVGMTLALLVTLGLRPRPLSTGTGNT
jgi:hypothetical protein